MEKESKTIGNVFLSGNELQVSFQYSKPRFMAIRSMKGASYNKELKRWCLPVTSLDNLLQSKLFSEKYLRYTFDKDIARQNAQHLNGAAKEALSHIDANPFEVDECYIEKVELDCVIRSTSGLRVFIKKRSRARKLIESIAGVYYLKSESSYFLPTSEIKNFICTLRDNKLSFAVSKETALKLKAGASLRSDLQNMKKEATAESYEQAMLVPFVTLRSDKACLRAFVPEQLQELFPEVRGLLARERLASSLSVEGLAKLILNSEQSKVKVWIPYQILEQLRDSLYYIESGDVFQFLPEYLKLLMGQSEPTWLCDYNGAGLLCSNPEDYLEFTKAEFLTTHPQFSYLSFIKPKDENLLEFHQNVQEKFGELRESPEFKKYYQSLKSRMALRQRCQQFQKLHDCDPEMQDKTLQANLFPHQRVAVKWLLETPRAFLGDDMGLGKTLSVLSTFQELLQRDENDFLLIVAPNSLVLNWFREAQRWTSKLRFALLPDAAKAKEACLKELINGSYYNGLIINYEKIRLDYIYPAIKEMCENHRVMLCLDESQRVKNPTSKVCKVLRVIAPLCQRRVLLSGTPTPRDLADIWSQMLLLDDGERFGTSYYVWLTKVAEIGNQWSEYAVRRFLPDKIDETISRVQELLLRRRKGDVIDLPEKLFSVRDLELTGDQAKRYDEVRKELLLRVKDIDGTTTVKQIESILEEYLRAVQIASNPRIIDEEWQGEPIKFLELDEIVDEVINGQAGKLVIWTNFRHNVEELVGRYSKYGAKPFYGDISTKERDKTIKEFQNPSSKVKILVAIPAAGGVGITLTAAQTAVYLEKTWDGEHWQQSVDRIHRIGQTGTVNIISLQACPVDELISANLAKKARIQAKLLGDTGRYKFTEESEESLLPSKEELLAAVAEPDSSSQQSATRSQLPET